MDSAFFLPRGFLPGLLVVFPGWLAGTPADDDEGGARGGTVAKEEASTVMEPALFLSGGGSTDVGSIEDGSVAGRDDFPVVTMGDIGADDGKAMGGGSGGTVDAAGTTDEATVEREFDDAVGIEAEAAAVEVSFFAFVRGLFLGALPSFFGELFLPFPPPFAVEAVVAESPP